MDEKDFATSFTVDQSPEEVFAAINNVRGWWSGDIEGETDAPGATFTYRYEDLHSSRQQISAFVPGRLVVWHVDQARLNFTARPDEWNGSDITFEILGSETATEVRFTHRGLTPALECYEKCAGAWTFYVCDSLKHLITSGAKTPNPVASSSPDTRK